MRLDLQRFIVPFVLPRSGRTDLKSKSAEMLYRTVAVVTNVDLSHIADPLSYGYGSYIAIYRIATTLHIQWMAIKYKSP